MSNAVIVDYNITWALGSDAGRIDIKTELSNRYIRVRLSNPHEFGLIMTLLQGPKSVRYDTDHGVFSTA